MYNDGRFISVFMLIAEVFTDYVAFKDRNLWIVNI